MIGALKDAKYSLNSMVCIFEEIFALIARQDIITLMLSLVASKSWTVQHMDVKSAFLNEYIYEEVYVVQCQGFEVQGREYHVYKLNKAFYGLKQALRAWYTRINGYFKSMGFQRSVSSLPCTSRKMVLIF